uniref:Probable RNA-binding protein EIF1AD n=1 Tax=Lutzomyia longipalpis TaxID=7200 RepID=A0A7G3AX00_LUTLO
MSHTTRRKHLMREFMLDNLDLPTENQTIVKVTACPGNNLFVVEPPGDAETFLVSLPTKFRRNMWVQRGSYVLVEPIDEGNKVKAEIVKILMPEHIEEYTKANIWPEKFRKTIKEPADASPRDITTLPGNPNRPEEDSEDDETSSNSS